MKRKTLVRICTFTLAIMLILSGFIIKYAAQASSYRYMEGNAQLHAVTQLSESLAQMSNTLTKGMYVKSPELLSSISSEIWNYSGVAVAAMAALPLSDVSLEKTSSFISTAGDYAHYIGRRAAAHTELTEEERGMLKSLAEIASSLAGDVLNLENDIYAGTVTFVSSKDNLASAIDSFSGIEEAFPEYEAVDYDGMMSGHIENRKPQLTIGQREISFEEAREIAAAGMMVYAGQVLFDDENAGTLPAYNFYTESGSFATVSKQGGCLVSVRHTAQREEGETGLREAQGAAQEYLDAIGYGSMEPAYYFNEGNAAVFRFIYSDNGVAVYPDMITVGVSLMDGSIVSLNAYDYIMNHQQRDLEEPAITQAEAAAMFQDDLKLNCTGRVLVNTPGYQERQCYEFYCETEDGQKMFIYSDVRTGDQCKLLLINDGDRGIILT